MCTCIGIGNSIVQGPCYDWITFYILQCMIFSMFYLSSFRSAGAYKSNRLKLDWISRLAACCCVLTLQHHMQDVSAWMYGCCMYRQPAPAVGSSEGSLTDGQLLQSQRITCRETAHSQEVQTVQPFIYKRIISSLAETSMLKLTFLDGCHYLWKVFTVWLLSVQTTIKTALITTPTVTFLI